METRRRTSEGAEPKTRSGKGILRSASGRADSGLRKAESARVKGRAASLCDSASLPRASRVISTAEGSTRRTSVPGLLPRDPRPPVSTDPAPDAPSEYAPGPRPSPPPLPKSASLPCPGPAPRLFSPSFTVDSLFTDTIFGESAAKGHALLSLNTSLVRNISGPAPSPAPCTRPPGEEPPPHRHPNGDVTAPSHMTPDTQSLASSPQDQDQPPLWYEYGCV